MSSFPLGSSMYGLRIFQQQCDTLSATDAGTRYAVALQFARQRDHRRAHAFVHPDIVEGVQESPGFHGTCSWQFSARRA
ncbi:MAG: hypothetical protein KBF63_14925 [Rhodoferax sp.]|nr:hypothetical protein [Rhodoferax sp.]